AITQTKLTEDERAARLLTERQLRIATAERLAAMSYANRLGSPEASLLLAIESGRATRPDEEGLLPSSHQALLAAPSMIGVRPLGGRDLAAGAPDRASRVLTGHQGEITSLAISPDSRWVVTASIDKTAQVWDLTAEDSSAMPRVLSGHQDQINCVAFSPDGHS